MCRRQQPKQLSSCRKMLYVEVAVYIAPVDVVRALAAQVLQVWSVMAGTLARVWSVVGCGCGAA